MKRTLLLMLLCILYGWQTMSAQTAYVSFMLNDGNGRSALTFRYDNDFNGHLDPGVTHYPLNSGDNEPGWLEHAEEINYIDIHTAFTQNVKPTTMFAWFRGMSKLINLPKALNDINTSEVTNMAELFSGCSGLTNIDLSGFNTSKVTTMKQMFLGCSSLTKLNISSFNTENVKYFNSMFEHCRKLSSLDVSHFNTSQSVNMRSMFSECKNLASLDVSNFNTANVTTFAGMFKYCDLLTSLDLSGFNTKRGADFNHMFAYCSNLTSLDLSNFDMDLSNFDMTLNSYASCMFYCDKNLKTIYVGRGWSEEGLTSPAMFYNCYKLVGGAGTTYNEYNADGAYARVDGGTSNPGYLTLKETYVVFDQETGWLKFYCDGEKDNRQGKKYTLNTGTDKPEWNTDGTNKKVTKVVFDFSFANAQPTSMYFWFEGMDKLTSVTGTANLKADKVTTMRALFNECTSLPSIDFSGLNTPCLKDAGYMFNGCTSLTEINLKEFDTQNVTDMGYMFANCHALPSLNISDFNTESVKTTIAMFFNSRSLTSIFVGEGWTMKNVETGLSNFMFQNCIKLTGSAGTTYDGTHYDAAYAHIDGGTSNPGYLSEGELTSYGLIVGGVPVTSANKDQIPVPNGRAFYNPDTKVLWLLGCTINGTGGTGGSYAATGYGAGIYSNINGLIVFVQDTVRVNGSSNNGDGIFFDDRTELTGTGTLIAKGNDGIYSDTLSIYSVNNIKLTIIAEGTNGGLVAKRDKRTRPELIYSYNRPLHLVDKNVVVKGKGSTISGISYWQEISGHPRLTITSPDPQHTQWNSNQHMICDTYDNGHPILDQWVVIEAPSEKYNLWVGGTQVTNENVGDVLGDGKVLYDVESKTLLLNGAQITGTGSLSNPETGYSYGIYSEIDSLIIDVQDTTTVTSGTDNSSGTGIYLDGNTTIKGSAQLTAVGPTAVRLYSKATSLTVGGDVTLVADGALTGLKGYYRARTLSMAKSALVVKENATVKAKGENYSYDGWKELILENDRAIIEPAGTVYIPDKLTMCDADSNVVAGQWVIIAKAKTVEKYNLWVGGVQVTDENQADILGDGKVTYSPKSKTLLLKNARITGQGSTAATGYGAAIYSELANLTIQVTGQNLLAGSGKVSLALLGTKNTITTGKVLNPLPGVKTPVLACTGMVKQGASDRTARADTLILSGDVALTIKGNLVGNSYARLTKPTYYSTLSIAGKASLSCGQVTDWAQLVMTKSHVITKPVGGVFNSTLHAVCDGKTIADAVEIMLFTYNPADVNRDGTVDSADIVAVIKEMPDGDKKADVNGDGVIDSADIVAVIKAMK